MRRWRTKPLLPQGLDLCIVVWSLDGSNEVKRFRALLSVSALACVVVLDAENELVEAH